MENYQPSQLLSMLSRFFERVVFEQLYEYIYLKKLFIRPSVVSEKTIQLS